MYIPRHELYAPHTSVQERQAGRVGKLRSKVDIFVRKNVFPLIPKLLQDVEPIPLYSIKVCFQLLFLQEVYIRAPSKTSCAFLLLHMRS